MFGATTSYSFSMVPQLVDSRAARGPRDCFLIALLDHRRMKRVIMIERTKTFTRKGFLSRRSRVQSVVSVRL